MRSRILLYLAGARADGNPALGVDAEQQWAFRHVIEVLIDGLGRTPQLPIIVDDQDTPENQPWVQMRQLVFGGLIEVGVQP
jgi:hypothetical protein